MTQTLRRELRRKIVEILDSQIRYWEGRGEDRTLGDIADLIADAVMGVFFKEKK